jgi:hypothetical protein
MTADRTVQTDPSLARQLWTLFLLCTIPVHLWMILMLLRDYSWVVPDFGLRTYIGYVGYSLVAAFLESLIITVPVFLLGFLISHKWGHGKRLASQVLVLIVVTFWVVAGQVYFILHETPPEWFNWILLRLPFHRELALATLWGLITASIAVPLRFVLLGEKLSAALLTALDRLSVLAIFYLALDAASLLLVSARLIRGPL